MSNIYKTSDFTLASVLLSEDFRLEKLDRSNPKRVEFCFLDSDELQDTLQRFWHNEIKIEPRQFALDFEKKQYFCFIRTSIYPLPDWEKY